MSIGLYHSTNRHRYNLLTLSTGVLGAEENSEKIDAFPRCTRTTFGPKMQTCVHPQANGSHQHRCENATSILSLLDTILTEDAGRPVRERASRSPRACRIGETTSSTSSPPPPMQRHRMLSSMIKFSRVKKPTAMLPQQLNHSPRRSLQMPF